MAHECAYSHPNTRSPHIWFVWCHINVHEPGCSAGCVCVCVIKSVRFNYSNISMPFHCSFKPV